MYPALRLELQWSINDDHDLSVEIVSVDGTPMAEIDLDQDTILEALEDDLLDDDNEDFALVLEDWLTVAQRLTETAEAIQSMCRRHFNS